MKNHRLVEPDSLSRAYPATIPQLLVSVRNLAEARQAVAGGADWIDLKDPQQGPLGPVRPAVAREVAETFFARHPLSAAAGELLSWQAPGISPPLAARPAGGEWIANNGKDGGLLSVPGIRLLKLGLAGCGTTSHWQNRWVAAQEEIRAAGKRLVAVVYADWKEAAAPPPEQIVEQATDKQCDYLLIDTFCKTRGTMLDCLPLDELAALLGRARKASMWTVVAGSLSIASLRHLISLPIDVVAVRGAVCKGGRGGILQKDRIERFQDALRALPWSDR